LKNRKENIDFEDRGVDVKYNYWEDLTVGWVEWWNCYEKKKADAWASVCSQDHEVTEQD
jgi:hypothetical protein